MLKLQLDEVITYYCHHACDATNQRTVCHACRHADDGWYYTTVDADGLHRSTDIPRVNYSLRAVSANTVDVVALCTFDTLHMPRKFCFKSRVIIIIINIIIINVKIIVTLSQKCCRGTV